MLGAVNVHYEMGQRDRGMAVGGIGAMHRLGSKLGLPREINAAIPLLKKHLPYFESDHVLTMAYNVLAGWTESIRAGMERAVLRLVLLESERAPARPDEPRADEDEDGSDEGRIGEDDEVDDAVAVGAGA